MPTCSHPARVLPAAQRRHVFKNRSGAGVHQGIASSNRARPMMYTGEVKTFFWLPKWLDSSRLAERVLTLDPVQRALIGYSLVCTVNCIAGLCALNYGVMLGLVDASQANLLTWTGFIVTLCHYLVV